MRIVADTGPLLAAADRNDRAHLLSRTLLFEVGSELIVPLPVLVEADYLMRARLGSHVAALFLRAAADGAMTVDCLTPGLVRRAVEIDETYGDLDLGFADASVMALAERHRLPILTFDFADFRATRPSSGFWRLIVDEARYDESVQG